MLVLLRTGTESFGVETDVKLMKLRKPCPDLKAFA